MDNRAISFWRLVFLSMLLNVVSQTAHETGHWAVYQIFGRGPVWGFIGLVQWWGTPPLNPEQWVETSSSDGELGWLRLTSRPASQTEEALAAAAGPVASLLVALTGLWIARFSRAPTLQQIGLTLALLTALVMTLYYLRSPLRSGGDESDLAIASGIPKLLIDAVFGLAFAACLIIGLLCLENWPTRLKWLGAILIGSVITGILLTRADEIVRVQVNQGNLFFAPVFGFSLPVILVNGFALLGLWAWWQFARHAPSQ